MSKQHTREQLIVYGSLSFLSIREHSETFCMHVKLPEIQKLVPDSILKSIYSEGLVATMQTRKTHKRALKIHKRALKIHKRALKIHKHARKQIKHQKGSNNTHIVDHFYGPFWHCLKYFLSRGNILNYHMYRPTFVSACFSRTCSSLISKLHVINNYTMNLCIIPPGAFYNPYPGW